jgi:transposase
MIRKDLKTFKDGSVKTQIRVVEGYRPGPGLPPKQRTIKDFGYLEDNENQEEFMAVVAEFNASFKKDVSLRIEVPSNAKMYCGTNRRHNYGYKFLEAVYDKLEIGAFIDDYVKKNRLKNEYSPAYIFKFLILTRVLFPDSKRASCQLKDNFYGLKMDFTLQDIYRALDHFAVFETELQRYLNEKIKSTIGRDMSYAFFDVTNYFFEIDFPDKDGLRKRGVSKEHRVDPIVGMGLFMDANGLPVSMSIFPGNTSESLTLRPIMADIKKSYGLDRLIVVADKGLNSSKNIDEIVNNGDGYVVSQVLRGKKGQRYQVQLFDEDGYVSSKDGAYKYKLYEEEYTAINKSGEKEHRNRKVLIYWDEDDAMYDGYFCIITSEREYGEREIRRAYNGLWRIEQSFRMLKSDLYARPVFVWTSEHIRAHFLICFVSLLIVRIIQHMMGEHALSSERIARALNTATCQTLKGGIVHLDDVGGAIAFKKETDSNGKTVETLEYSDEDEIALDYKAIQGAFEVNFYDIYPRQEVFNKFLKNIGRA